MSLPLAAHNWIESFVESVYEYGLGEDRQQFLTLAVREVLESSLKQGGLLTRPEASLLGVDIAAGLFGFHRYIRHDRLWTAERRELFTSLRDLWPAWIDAAIGWVSCAAAALRLLSTPAAIDVRVDALLWLDASNERWLDVEDEEVCVALVGYLEVILAEHRVHLEGLGGPRKAFEHLVGVLVGLGQPRALMLAEKLARPTTL